MDRTRGVHILLFMVRSLFAKLYIVLNRVSECKETSTKYSGIGNQGRQGDYSIQAEGEDLNNLHASLDYLL